MKLHRSTTSRSPVICRDGHAIGLDLGATCVRAAVLSLGADNGRPSVAIKAVASMALPPGAVVDGSVGEQAVVTRALKKLWDTKGFDCRSVILGLAGPQVVVRPLQIPNLTAQQRAQALPFQAREIIALPLDEVILDYVQVGHPDPITGMLNGLLIATPRRPVLAAVEAVERAGLKVVRVDLASFGALRSIADEAMTIQAVIDVGAHLTSIVIHDHGVPQLARTLAHGGQELTESLVDLLDVSFEEAENIKFEHGLTSRGETASDTLRAAIRPLLAEIRSSINYFRASTSGRQIQAISLTGGGSALRGLAETLADQNGVPAQMVPALHHIAGGPTLRAPVAFGGTPEVDGAASAVSVGLAMGAAA